jgi:hypothetical protein
MCQSGVLQNVYDPQFYYGAVSAIVPTENSVPINQHPCGTLIADLVDALSLLASTSESKGWQSLPRPVVECI